MVASTMVQDGKPPLHTNGITCSHSSLQSAQLRIRQAAQKDKGLRFTTLWHHVYNVDQLRKAYLSMKRHAAPGVDDQTWQQYGEDLEVNLFDLSGRLQRGAYRAKPVKRSYIPKADGSQRPIGVPVLEDKIVQRATVEVLNNIYETDFKGFSYGFRPKRSPHGALDALMVGITTQKVNWVLDADIRGFFDAIDHEWMVKFIEHRIADQRVVRHVKKWLNAGVLEDGEVTRAEEGTPQGGSVSPLLANIYMHYAFDLWADKWRRQASGKVKPETFDFLGFTHICGKNRKGKFIVLRQTMRTRMQRKLVQLKLELRKRMHQPIPEVGKWLRSVLLGHYRYYGDRAIVAGSARFGTICSAIGSGRYAVGAS